MLLSLARFSSLWTLRASVLSLLGGVPTQRSTSTFLENCRDKATILPEGEVGR
jgi:hypothetical protein